MTKAIYDTRFLIIGYLIAQVILWPCGFAHVSAFVILTVGTIAGAWATNRRHQSTIK